MMTLHITLPMRRITISHVSKKKRCGTIKGQGCANERKQRVYINKQDASALTVATESLLLTCLTNASKNRDVAIVDVPRAFMQLDMKGPDTHLQLEGRMVSILAKIDKKLYKKYIVEENRKQVMYVKLKKTLYGTIQAAVIFWKKLDNNSKIVGIHYKSLQLACGKQDG